MPSQCCCARFGELTAINNMQWKDEETGQKQKKQGWVEESQLFLSETVLEKEFKEFEELLTDTEVNL